MKLTIFAKCYKCALAQGLSYNDLNFGLLSLIVKLFEMVDFVAG